MLVMMTVMTMISWQWQISAAEDDAGLWQCMYNVRGRPCDAADSPMKREIWVVLLLLVMCNCMRASFQFEGILLFLTLRTIIDGTFKCLFVITCWFDMIFQSYCLLVKGTCRGNLLRMVPSVLVWHQQKHFFSLKDWAKMKSESSIIYVTMEKKHSGQAPTLGL